MDVERIRYETSVQLIFRWEFIIYCISVLDKPESALTACRGSRVSAGSRSRSPQRRSWCASCTSIHTYSCSGDGGALRGSAASSLLSSCKILNAKRPLSPAGIPLFPSQSPAVKSRPVLRNTCVHLNQTEITKSCGWRLKAARTN